ncbi:MAG TPA: DNA starvation/stationary phase protection protein [Candidatus Babeliales bacterium]|nr:DNA starvation/stationary phase protection protein [Candidatus Babeliales bacterium]
MEPNIGISTQQRKECAAMLNKLLADEFIVYVKTLNYHWNIISPDFDPMHAFFLKQYEALLEISDEVAERVRALGERSFGTMEEFLQNTRLKEQSGVVPSKEQMLKNLLNDHEAIIRTIRTDQDLAMNKYNDAGTNNFLCELMEKHEKMAWMIRSFLG